MSEFFPLPTKPDGVIPPLVERFNSGKVSAIIALYARDSVLRKRVAGMAVRHAHSNRAFSDKITVRASCILRGCEELKGLARVTDQVRPVDHKGMPHGFNTF